MQHEFSRTDRVAGEIRRVLADLIREELADPRIGMVSLTSVEVSRDLSHARIFVSALEMAGSDAQTSVEALNGAAGLLRRQMGRRIKFRVLPSIRFFVDDTERDAVELEARIQAARQADRQAAKRRGDSSDES